jgi:hypothetical protein
MAATSINCLAAANCPGVDGGVDGWGYATSGADQALHLAAGHRQVDAVQGPHARVVLDQPADLQQRAVGLAHPPITADSAPVG